MACAGMDALEPLVRQMPREGGISLEEVSHAERGPSPEEVPEADPTVAPASDQPCPAAHRQEGPQRGLR